MKMARDLGNPDLENQAKLRVEVLQEKLDQLQNN